MSARRLGRVAWVVAAPLLLMGVREPGGLGTSSGGDTLTASYQVSGVRVIQRVNPATDVVAVRLYLLGGTRQLTEQATGDEPTSERPGHEDLVWPRTAEQKRQQEHTSELKSYHQLVCRRRC